MLRAALEDKYCTKFSMIFVTASCDFEADTCLWTNYETATFSWIRHSGSSSEFGTGPQTDHTLGTDIGTVLPKTIFKKSNKKQVVMQ